MGRFEDGQAYVHDYARTLAQRLNIRVQAISRVDCAVKLQLTQFSRLKKEIGREKAPTLGRLASCGLKFDQFARGVTLGQVHGDNRNWLQEELESGLELLEVLATTAVIAAMADNIWAELQKKPFAKVEKDGFVLEVLKATFKNWQGVQFSIRVSRNEAEVRRGLFVDKDDPCFAQAGICKRGENFQIRDPAIAAKAVLGTVEITPGELLPESRFIRVGSEVLFEWDAEMQKFTLPVGE